MAEDLTSSGPWATQYAHCNTLVKLHSHQHHDSSKADHKRLKSGWWPSSWKFPHLLQNSWNNPVLPLISLWNYPAHEIYPPHISGTLTFWDGLYSVNCILAITSLIFRDGSYSVYGMCLQINPLLTHHFVSHWILSAMRYWEPEIQSALRTGVWFQFKDSGFRSQSELHSFIGIHLHAHTHTHTHTHMHTHTYTHAHT